MEYANRLEEIKYEEWRKTGNVKMWKYKDWKHADAKHITTKRHGDCQHEKRLKLER